MSFWICKYDYQNTHFCKDYENEDCDACEYGMEVNAVRQIIGCKYCEDMDVYNETVCYIPHDNGKATDIPVNFCPNCGRKLVYVHE